MKKSSMKKMFTAVMAASMVFASTTLSFAGGTATQFDFPENGSPADSILATEVSYVASDAVADYTVTVPQSIVISGSKVAGSASGEVKITGMTTTDITVTADDTIEMVSTGGAKLNADVTLDSPVKLSASASSAEATSTANIFASWSGEAPAVDSWSGTIHYTVTAGK